MSLTIFDTVQSLQNQINNINIDTTTLVEIQNSISATVFKKSRKREILEIMNIEAEFSAGTATIVIISNSEYLVTTSTYTATIDSENNITYI